MMNINWLLEQGPCKSFASGDVIPCPPVKADEPKAMYILLSGAVDVFGKSPVGGVRKVSSIIEGDVFGGREFFIGPTDLVYRASENSTVYVLTKDSFDDLSWSQPDILFEILHSAYLPPRQPSKTAAPPPQTKPAVAPAPAPTATTAEPAVDRAAVQAKVAAVAKATKDGMTVSSLQLPGHKKYSSIALSVDEKIVTQRKYTCPLCKKEFSDFYVSRTKLRESKPMRYDLRRFYDGIIIEWYDLITCPHCYFTTFHTYFTDPKPLKKTEIEDYLIAARAELPIDFSAPRDINLVFTMHYLALLCCNGYPSLYRQIRAKIWGNLSWLYEDVLDTQLETAAAGKAAEAYENVYAEIRQSPTQEQIVCLSIAGMQTRAGVDRNLNRYVYTAKTMEMGDRTYVNIAEDFMNERGISDENLEKMAKK